MTTKTASTYHYIRTLAFERTGRARRGTDASAKKYHLTYCGRELTQRELEAQSDLGVEYDCKTCSRAEAASLN